MDGEQSCSFSGLALQLVHGRCHFLENGSHLRVFGDQDVEGQLGKLFPEKRKSNLVLCRVVYVQRTGQRPQVERKACPCRWIRISLPGKCLRVADTHLQATGEHPVDEHQRDRCIRILGFRHDHAFLTKGVSRLQLLALERQIQCLGAGSGAQAGAGLGPL